LRWFGYITCKDDAKLIGKEFHLADS